MGMIVENFVLNKVTYFDRFYEIKGVDLSDKRAYLILEEEYFARFGENRYSSYNTFRNGKHRYLKTLLNK